MTKEEMFDFILVNTVTLTPSSDMGMWTNMETGEKFRIKYTVAINNTQMCGMDLEESIQYYALNFPNEDLRKTNEF